MLKDAMKKRLKFADYKEKSKSQHSSFFEVSTLKKGQLKEKREDNLIKNVDKAMDFSHDVNNLEAMMPSLKSKMAKSLLSTINKDREKRSKKS